ncbi:MAG: hypothetical protein JWN59_1242 [Sphingomonas bacterium]|nr:hypothetical protein [Sphingomonas bacterium]
MRRLGRAPDGLANRAWVAATAAGLADVAPAPPRASPQALRRASVERALAAKLLDAHLRNRVQAMQSRPTDLTGLPETEASLLIRAMIAAGHADGVLDPDERKRLIVLARDGIRDDAVRQKLLAEVDAPPAIEQLIRLVETPHSAERFYAVSAAVAHRPRAANRAYLAYLAIRLEIAEDVMLRINRETADPAPRAPRSPG